jgi:hypothetical protein
MWQNLLPMLSQAFGGQRGGGMPGQNGGGIFGGGGFGYRAGQLGSGLFNLFGAKNPSDAASPYLDSMEGDAAKYLNPWMDAGKRSLGNIESQYNQNVNDPTGVMNKIGAGFQQSPGYQFQVDQATEAANRSAAAGGMAGTPAEQQKLASTVNGLANQDYYNYTDRGMKQYNSGLEGLSHINDQGFQGSQLMAQIMQMMRQMQAQNAYEGANTQNQQRGGAIGSIINSIF